MKTLVTGGGGAIGEFVVAELKQAHEVIVLDVRPPARHTDVPFRQVDLLDPDATAAAVQDVDIIVHLAAIPHPFDDPGDRVMHVNMVTAYNVAEAARNCGVRRVIYGGSDSGTGFGIHNVVHKPLYLPMDVAHPCWPHESYSLSKYFGEQIFREYSRAYHMEVVSVRFLWVLLERNRASIEKLLATREREPPTWLGGYVMPQDVAKMIRLAAEYDMVPDDPFPFAAFYAHAARTFNTTETLEQAAKLWGTVPEIRRPGYYERNPFAPFFDLTDACEKLGYRPQFSIEDF